MNSCIYTGRVHHRRYGATAHSLDYRVFYFLLDIDELDALAQTSRWFSVNRRGWFAYHDADHGNGTGISIANWCRDVLRRVGLDVPVVKFQMLTMPRVLGYVFNPISVIYCLAADDDVAAVIYEVRNTFGERIAYCAPAGRGPGTIRQRCTKEMFVSPFFSLEGFYDFRLDRPGDRLHFAIDYFADGERRLHAAFHGARRPFDSQNLAALALRHSSSALKVTAGIHFEALNLWRKGAPLVRHMKLRRDVSLGTEL